MGWADLKGKKENKKEGRVTVLGWAEMEKKRWKKKEGKKGGGGEEKEGEKLGLGLGPVS